MWVWLRENKCLKLFRKLNCNFDFNIKKVEEGDHLSRNA